MHATLETDRLKLNVLHPCDADKVLSFYDNNKDYFEPWEPERDPNFYTLQFQRLTLSIEYNLMLQSKLLRYWVFLKNDSHTIIGTINFYNILHGYYSCCQLGYKFDQRFTGQGYAQESLKEGINIIYKEHQLHRIEANIMPHNKPSIKLIERLGFHYEGLSISSLKINGNWEDHCRYAYVLD